MKIAVLDDYLHLSQKFADWSKLPPGCEVTATQEFFQSAYADTVENIVAFAAGRPIRVLAAERNDSRLVR